MILDSIEKCSLDQNRYLNDFFYENEMADSSANSGSNDQKGKDLYSSLHLPNNLDSAYGLTILNHQTSQKISPNEPVTDLNTQLERNSQLTPSNLSDKALDLALKKLVKSERKIMHLVLLHIQEFDRRRLYLNFGYTSLYQHLTQALGYSETAAYDRMQAARLLNCNPEVSSQIENGSLNLSQLVKVSTYLKHEKKVGNFVSKEQTSEIFKKIENKNAFETEKVLAQVFDYVPVQMQKVKPQKDSSVILQVTLTHDQYEKFKQVQSLISHAVTDQNIADAITYLGKFYLSRVTGRMLNDTPNEKLNGNQNFQKKIFTIEKSHQQVAADEEALKALETIETIETVKTLKTAETAETASTKIALKEVNASPSDDSTVPIEATKFVMQSFGETPSPARVRKSRPSMSVRSGRVYISVHVKRSVMQKANYSCEYIHSDTQQRCCSTYQLQIDHKMPLAFGGGSELQNLRVLCGVHNRAEAELMQLLL